MTMTMTIKTLNPKEVKTCEHCRAPAVFDVKYSSMYRRPDGTHVATNLFHPLCNECMVAARALENIGDAIE
jgi:hypothetical protein